VHRCVLGKDT